MFRKHLGAPSARRPQRTVAAALGICTMLLFAPPAEARQIVLEPDRDTTIFAGETGNSNGGGDLFVGLSAGLVDLSVRRGLIRFDLSSLPPGAQITGARLELTTLGSPGLNPTTPTVGLHRLLVEFGEGTTGTSGLGTGLGNTAVAPDATWDNRITPATPWDLPGGRAGVDYVATASASSASGVIGSTPDLVADVQGWFDDPQTNHGWIMIGNENITASARRYGARENSQSSNRPRLVIDFVGAPQQPTEAIPLLSPALMGTLMAALALIAIATLRRSPS